MKAKNWLRKAAYVGGLVTTLTMPLFSQTKSITAYATKEKINLDGKLDETSWNNAETATNFIQKYPAYGEKPSQKTEVKVLRDKENLYFGFKCHQDPKTIKSTSLERDQIYSDYFCIALDANKDKRTAYVFKVSPNNTQADAKTDNNGKAYNSNWDEIWHSKTKTTKQGWQGEIQIPVKNLKFNQDTTWHINFLRVYNHNRELMSWAECEENFYQTDKFNQLKNIKEFQQKRQIDLKPYVRLSTNIDTLDRDWGIDSKINIANNTDLYITYNPDYSQIEADPERFNLSTNPLYLIEKRTFFIEGLEVLRTPLNLTYTRSIDDIIAGTKVIGKKGEHSYLLLNAHTSEKSKNPNTNFTIARYKLDALNSSNIGIIAINKQNKERYNSTAGLDVQLDLPKNVSVAAICARAKTKNEKAGNALKANISWKVNQHTYLNLGGIQIDSTFNNEVGYETMKGKKGAYLSAHKTIKFKKAIENLSFGGGLSEFLKQKNQLANSNKYLFTSLGVTKKLSISGFLNSGKENYQDTIRQNSYKSLSMYTEPVPSIQTWLSISQNNFLNQKYINLSNGMTIKPSQNTLFNQSITYLMNKTTNENQAIYTLIATYKINEFIKLNSYAQARHKGKINFKELDYQYFHGLLTITPNKKTNIYLVGNYSKKEEDKALFFKASRLF